MIKTAELFWSSLEEECKRNKSSSMNIHVDSTKKEKYLQQCEASYQQYKNSFMKEDVENLDRHKVAAILVIEGISCELITCSNVPDKSFFYWPRDDFIYQCI